MNIINFTREGGTEPELFACGKCGVLQSKLKFCGADDAYAASIAEECCSPRECSVCGLNIERFRTMCSACAETAKFNKAEKITENNWDGPVEYNEQFFGDVHEAMESIDDLCENPEDRPHYVNACDKIKGFSFDPGHIEEGLLEEMEDGFEIEGIEEIYKFAEKWNSEQTQEYWMTTSTIVLLDWAQWDLVNPREGNSGDCEFAP